MNVDAGREGFAALAPAASSRKVMVVGGGMAGMEAARVAAERGHEVTLYEKTDQLGGRINVMRAPRHRVNWGRAAEDRVRMCENAGVRVLAGTLVDANVIRTEHPDVLIVATGTRPFMPGYVPGIGHPMVTSYDDVVRGRVEVGSKVLVVGGQELGLTTAEFLAENGADVTVVEATDALATDLEFMAQKMLLARVERSNQIHVRLNSNIEEIHEDRVLVPVGRRNGDVGGCRPGRVRPGARHGPGLDRGDYGRPHRGVGNRVPRRRGLRLAGRAL